MLSSYFWTVFTNGEPLDCSNFGPCTALEVQEAAEKYGFVLPAAHAAALINGPRFVTVSTATPGNDNDKGNCEPNDC
jgi:hypothetical protein